LIEKGSWCHLMMDGVEKWLKQWLEVKVPLTHFFGVFEVLILSDYGLELVFYGWFMLLEVFGSLFDKEIEV
jgi:hypothetical protein